MIFKYQMNSTGRTRTALNPTTFSPSQVRLVHYARTPKTKKIVDEPGIEPGTPPKLRTTAKGVLYH